MIPEYEVILDDSCCVCIRPALFNDDGDRQVTHWPDPCEFKPIKSEFKRLARENEALREALDACLASLDEESAGSVNWLRPVRDQARAALALSSPSQATSTPKPPSDAATGTPEGKEGVV